MTTELSVIPSSNIQHDPIKIHAAFFDLSPAAMVARAVEMANVFMPIIEKQNLAINCGGQKKHIKIEGWILIGNLLGAIPQEREVKEYNEGSYEAHVDLIYTKTGMVIGGASGICEKEEPLWSKRPRFARRSMAITRATGKAYRLGFSWIVVLAGYDPTPAEEMPTTQETAVSHEVVQKQNGYDPGNAAHREGLSKELEKRSLPLTRFADVEAKMKGRSSTDIDSVLKEIFG